MAFLISILRHFLAAYAVFLYSIVYNPIARQRDFKFFLLYIYIRLHSCAGCDILLWAHSAPAVSAPAVKRRENGAIAMLQTTINSLRRSVVGTIRHTGSQSEAAALAGVSQGTISRFVRGERLRETTLASIAQKLCAYWRKEAAFRAFEYTDARGAFDSLDDTAAVLLMRLIRRGCESEGGAWICSRAVASDKRGAFAAARGRYIGAIQVTDTEAILWSMRK